MKRRHSARGDTIIEVVMAVAMFSMLAIGIMALMNSGIAMAQRSLELTLVRQQIDSQAEMLRYIHDKSSQAGSSFATLWDAMKGRTIDHANSLLNVNRCPEAMPSGGFALAPSKNTFQLIANKYELSPTYAKISTARNPISLGISIQLVRVEGGRAYDAYIQACWMSVGTDRPMTTGTIVRMYDTAV